MKCVMCGAGNLINGTKTSTFERDGTMIIIKNVPAQVCNQCDEGYYDAPTTNHLLEIAERVIQSGVEIGILTYKIKE